MKQIPQSRHRKKLDPHRKKKIEYRTHTNIHIPTSPFLAIPVGSLRPYITVVMVSVILVIITIMIISNQTSIRDRVDRAHQSYDPAWQCGRIYPRFTSGSSTLLTLRVCHVLHRGDLTPFSVKVTYVRTKGFTVGVTWRSEGSRMRLWSTEYRPFKLLWLSSLLVHR